MNTESYSGHNRPTHKSRLPTDCQTHQRQDDNNTTASTLPPEYKNFRTNLANLRKAISSEKTLADVDATALARDLERHPRPPLDHNGAPFWDGSDAQRLLRLDVDAGKHTSMTKTELRGSRPEYGLFTPKVFRKHIEQEERRCKYIEYLRQVQLRK
jgi:hypothetical protein